jgi:undecaprenyl-diphosphatase
MSRLFRRVIAWERALMSREPLPVTSRWRWLAVLGAHLGDGPLWAAIAIGLLIGGNLFLRSLTLVTGCAVLGSTGISTAIKYAVRRHRPREETQFYAIKYDRYSFPSGHATRMAAIAVIVGHFVPSLAVVGYVLACAVGICRILVGVHYPSDVLVGLLIGFAGADGVLRWF